MIRVATPLTIQFEQWLLIHGVAGTATPRTASIYRSHAEYFIGSFGDPMDATRRTIDRWRERIAVSRAPDGTEHEAKPNTINQKISAIKALFTFMVDQGLREDNPAEHLKRKKHGRRMPHALKDSEVNGVFEQLRHADGPEGLQDLALIHTLYGSGLRRDEAGNLRLKHLDLQTKTLKVVSGKGDKDRIVIMNDPQYRALRDWLLSKYADERVQSVTEEFGKDAALLDLQRRTPEGSVFFSASGTPIADQKDSGNGVYKRVRRYGFNPHAYRHTFATALWENGADIAKIMDQMGHTNVNTTMIYTHLRQKGLDALRQQHPMQQKGMS